MTSLCEGEYGSTGRAGREESQQYIAPGNPMHSRTYKNNEGYLTASGKMEIIRQVLKEAISEDTCDKADEAPTSLLSETKRRKEPLASCLPWHK